MEETSQREEHVKAGAGEMPRPVLEPKLLSLGCTWNDLESFKNTHTWFSC